MVIVTKSPKIFALRSVFYEKNTFYKRTPYGKKLIFMRLHIRFSFNSKLAANAIN